MIYYLFKDVPARQTDFIAYSGSTTFPKKFCRIRWAENSQMAKKAIKIQPHLLSHVSGIKENGKVPTCRSFTVVTEFLNSLLLSSFYILLYK